MKRTFLLLLPLVSLALGAGCNDPADIGNQNGAGTSGASGQPGGGQAGDGTSAGGQAGGEQAGNGQAGRGQTTGGPAGSGQAGGQAGSGQAGSGQAGSGTGGTGGVINGGTCPDPIPLSCEPGDTCTGTRSDGCPANHTCYEYFEQGTWSIDLPPQDGACGEVGKVCSYARQVGNSTNHFEAVCSDTGWKVDLLPCIRQASTAPAQAPAITPFDCTMPDLCPTVTFSVLDPAAPAPAQPSDGPLAHEGDPAATACFLQALRDQTVGKLTVRWESGAQAAHNHVATTTIHALGFGRVIFDTTESLGGQVVDTYQTTQQLRVTEETSYFDTCLAASSTSARAQCVVGVTDTATILPPDALPPWSTGECHHPLAACP